MAVDVTIEGEGCVQGRVCLMSEPIVAPVKLSYRVNEKADTVEAMVMTLDGTGCIQHLAAFDRRVLDRDPQLWADLKTVFFSHFRRMLSDCGMQTSEESVELPPAVLERVETHEH